MKRKRKAFLKLRRTVPAAEDDARGRPLPMHAQNPVFFVLLARTRFLLYTPAASLHRMFAVVTIAGFQEKVKVGDTLTVPRLPEEAGKNVVFSDVLLLADDAGSVTLGAPFVAGASVEASVLGHGRDAKVRVLKMRRRKRHLRVHGHRQEHTKIEVTKINA